MPISLPLGCDGHFSKGSKPCPFGQDPWESLFLLLPTLQKNRHLMRQKNFFDSIQKSHLLKVPKMRLNSVLFFNGELFKMIKETGNTFWQWLFWRCLVVWKIDGRTWKFSYRQQPSPLLYSIDIWPARNSRLTQRETNHYITQCASELPWPYLAGSSPGQLVMDLFGQHQRCPYSRESRECRVSWQPRVSS